MEQQNMDKQQDQQLPSSQPQHSIQEQQNEILQKELHEQKEKLASIEKKFQLLFDSMTKKYEQKITQLESDNTFLKDNAFQTSQVLAQWELNQKKIYEENEYLRQELNKLRTSSSFALPQQQQILVNEQNVQEGQNVTEIKQQEAQIVQQIEEAKIEEKKEMNEKNDNIKVNENQNLNDEEKKKELIIPDKQNQQQQIQEQIINQPVQNQNELDFNKDQFNHLLYELSTNKPIIRQRIVSLPIQNEWHQYFSSNHILITTKQQAQQIKAVKKKQQINAQLNEQQIGEQISQQFQNVDQEAKSLFNELENLSSIVQKDIPQLLSLQLIIPQYKAWKDVHLNKLVEIFRYAENLQQLSMRFGHTYNFDNPSSQYLDEIYNFLEINKNPEDTNIYDNISLKGLYRLVQYMYEMPNLQVIDLYFEQNNTFNDIFFDMLHKFLKTNNSIKQMHLKFLTNNIFTDGGLYSLAELLKAQNKLESLQLIFLKNTKFSDQGLSQISKAMVGKENLRIFYINLQSNLNIEDHFIERVSEDLLLCPYLKELYLMFCSCIKFTDRTPKFLGQLLSQIYFLEKIYLDFTNGQQCSEKAWLSFLKNGIKQQAWLRVLFLDLTWNKNITNQIFKGIRDALENKYRLQRLYLNLYESSQNITHVGMPDLELALLDKSRLCEFQIDLTNSQDLTDKTLQMFENILAGKSDLQVFSFANSNSRNNFSDKGIELLANGIKDKIHLRDFRLYLNENELISDSGMKILYSVLENLHNLKILKLSLQNAQKVSKEVAELFKSGLKQDFYDKYINIGGFEY